MPKAIAKKRHYLLWGLVGLIVGIGVGALAYIPTGHRNSFKHLGQGLVQGASRGTLIGTSMHAFIVMFTIYLERKGFSVDVGLDFAIESIRSFTICGGILGTLIVMVSFTKQVIGEDWRRRTALKFVIVGIVSGFVFFAWLNIIDFFIAFSITGMLFLATIGAVFGSIIGVVFAANNKDYVEPL